MLNTDIKASEADFDSSSILPNSIVQHNFDGSFQVFIRGVLLTIYDENCKDVPDFHILTSFQNKKYWFPIRCVFDLM